MARICAIIRTSVLLVQRQDSAFVTIALTHYATIALTHYRTSYV